MGQFSSSLRNNRGAPICPAEEAPKIPTFKAPEIPTLFAQAPKFPAADFLSFSVKIGHFEGLNKIFEKSFKLKVQEQVFFYCMVQYFCTKA